MNKLNTAALAAFDNLPDSARVRVQVVAAVEGYSVPTAWRRARSGALPQPQRDGNVTTWGVGDIRRLREQRSAKKAA